MKSHLGINFSEKYSLSHYFPFNILVPNNIIPNPPPGIIINDSYDSFSFSKNKAHLWMSEKGMVTKEYDSMGLNNSQCLLIKSSSAKSWAYSYHEYIEVKKGDVFNFTASAKLTGTMLRAYAAVSVFDEQFTNISWKYFSVKTERVDKWITLEKTFTIPDGISYIRFRLTGAGAGEYRFDDVSFSKK